MQLSDLTVEVRDVNLVRQGQVEDRYLDCKLEPRFNAPGVWTLKLPQEHPMASVLAEPGSGIIVTHTDPAVGVLLSGPSLSPVRAADKNDPQGTSTFTGTTDDVLLWRRIAYPLPTSADVTAQTVSHDVRIGAAETIMRAYVDANLGPSSPVARRVTGLTLAPNLARGPSLTYSARFDRIGDLLASLATVAGLGFRVVQIGTHLEFQVYDPTDKSDLIRLDLANGTLTAQSVERSAATLTRAIVAGQGVGELRTLVEVAAAAEETGLGIFGRIEGFVDQRNTDDPAELTQAGTEAILDGASGLAVRAVPGDDTTMAPVTDWWLGDVLGLVVDDTEATAQVTGATILVNSSVGVTVGASIGDVQGWDPQAPVRRELKAQDERVSNLERNLEATADPVGQMVTFGGTTAPPGWLLCDGAAVSRSTYADLFAAIGTTYGAGNGTTTFNLPNQPKGEEVRASNITPQTGTNGADLIYNGFTLTLPPGTWEIRGGIQGQSNVLDAQAASIWCVTAGGEEPLARGDVKVTGAPPDASGLWTRPIIRTISATTQWKMMLCRNGGSTPSVIGSGIASAPAAWLDAKRTPWNPGPTIIRYA